MKITSILVFAGALLVSLPVARADANPDPKHLAEAEALVRTLDLSRTNYEHGEGAIVWTGTQECHTDCSGFLDHLFSRCYSLDKDALRRWLGSRRPTAARYHDAVVGHRGFTELTRIQDAKPGDILAVKYLIEKENTGHVMLVAEIPRRMKESKPLVPNTEQWEVTVIDSSKSGHGKTDTRHAKGADGKDHDGLGRGIVRVYTAKDGAVAGFSWSTLAASKFQEPKEEHLVIGRIVAGYKP